ncbi:Hypothetical predicted protein [Scomber scombrus]|uniref:Uncharacterized protein n=1 Tax=Scomber scombrus TaxID=13677 RepID=A0AAV1P2D3_SCOSC
MEAVAKPGLCFQVRFYLEHPTSGSPLGFSGLVKCGAANVTADLLNKHTELGGHHIQPLYEVGQVDLPLFPKQEEREKSAEASSLQADMLFIKHTVESACWICAHYRWKTEEFKDNGD